MLYTGGGDVRGTYDRMGRLHDVYALPVALSGMRKKAVEHMGLCPGSRVVELGSGTGSNFPYLHHAVGVKGYVYGVEFSPVMHAQAVKLIRRKKLDRTTAFLLDAMEYEPYERMDAVFFGLSYNTIPQAKLLMRRAWEWLKPGGCIGVMDLRVPGWLESASDTFAPYARKLGANPNIKPWLDMEQLAPVDLRTYLLGSGYSCVITKH